YNDGMHIHARAFLLDASSLLVPEPASFVLLAVGAVGLFWLRKTSLRNVTVDTGDLAKLKNLRIRLSECAKPCTSACFYLHRATTVLGALMYVSMAPVKCDSAQSYVGVELFAPQSLLNGSNFDGQVVGEINNSHATIWNGPTPIDLM